MSGCPLDISRREFFRDFFGKKSIRRICATASDSLSVWSPVVGGCPEEAGLSLGNRQGELGLLETLLMARQLVCLPKEIVIFGIELKEMSPGLGLSAEVAAVVPKVVGLVLEECSKEIKLPTP